MRAAAPAPARDGTAAIAAGAALCWIVASGTGTHAGSPEASQRKLVLTTLANMASKGHIGRGEDIAGYRAWPPGCQPPGRGAVPVIAGGRPGQRCCSWLVPPGRAAGR